MRMMAIGLLAAIAGALTVGVAGQAQKQTVSPQLQTGAGRYQVVSTNDDFYKEILVDTFTGNTWTVCNLDSPTDPSVRFKSWCAIERTNAHGVVNRPVAK